jgi:periodic tryptophan protein 1
VLAAASYDRTLSVTDARAPDKNRIARYGLPSDPEALQWAAHNPAAMLVGCEDGSMLSYDVRLPDKPLWHVAAAHAGALTCISQSLLVRGLLATGGLDKTVKLWDTLSAAPAARSAPAGAPVCIASKVMSIGQILSISFFPSVPFLLAAGGSKGMVAVWDIEADGGQPPTGAVVSPPVAVAGSDAGTGEAHLLAADASAPARHFAGRMVTDPASVPGNPLAIRARFDGQPL